MDGIFVPNRTVGIEGLSLLPQLSAGSVYEFHWMVQNPAWWIERTKGPHIHVVNIETIPSPDVFSQIQKLITDSGGKIGIAINPDTPLERILPYVRDVHVGRVLVMTVRPGFSGQSYLKEMESRIRQLRSLYPELDISVDGGINLSTIGGAFAAGANHLAAASAIFSSSNISDAIKNLREKALAGV